MTSADKSTPMLRQYLSIKEAHPDAILMYRMGDFFEMFFDDAKLASRVLEITLTSRNKKDEDPIPMCGVPARAVQGYLGRLIEAGYKVALCDQVEDAALAKGLVKREVVRVITPGTILENEFLDEKSNNYLLAVFHSYQTTGLSYVDISTGTFRLTESDDSKAIVDEVLRISPREVLLAECARKDGFFAPILRALSETRFTYLDDKFFEYAKSRERLLELFHTISLEGFGCETLKNGVSAAGALIHYVKENQRGNADQITGIETYRLDNFLMVDDISCRNLELLQNIRTGSRQGTLLSVLDKTITAMGGRLLKAWLRYPLMDGAQISDRLDAVEEARRRLPAMRNIREVFKGIADLERIGTRIVMGHANARDLTALQRSIQKLPDIEQALSEFESSTFQWDKGHPALYQLAELIERSIREDAPPTLHEGGLIKSGFNPELDELIQISQDGKGWLARLEIQERTKTGINTLKVRYNKVFGYYIEVSKNQAGSVPDHYVRKQTLVNAERYITDELKTFESKVLGAEERKASIEFELFDDIRKQAAALNPIIRQVSRFLARLDCLLSLAEVAEQNGYNRPDINTLGFIVIENGRHPVVEKMIAGERFVPNTIRMDNDQQQILVITGPNMAGKSTILRQVAIIVLMAQMGSFVPAEHATISIVDRIFTRVGALDNLSQGQSTFMVEMQETANILNNASPASLIILDEIGRGTSTFDGLSIAWAVAEYLHDFKQVGVKTLFATHYHELTELALTKPRVKNYNVAVKEWRDDIIFLRKLVEGGTNRSYGIQVARLAGIPPNVIERAKMVLSRIENGKPQFNSSILNTISERRHVQLDLFDKTHNLLLEELQMLDISRMTPLDAINCLNSLQEKAKISRTYS